jgi:SAM-dependent methyltransferase
MIDIAEHLFDWQLEIVFNNVARLLKPGGYIYIDAPLIPARPYSDMHVNIKGDAKQYLKFIPEFEIENVILVDPVGSNHLITLCKGK